MSSDPTAQELLGANWLFSDLGPGELAELSRVTLRRRYEAEAVVVRQGDDNGDLYAVVEGLLRVSVRRREERDLALNLLRRGDVCGELSLLDGLPRSATITALESSLLLVIRRAEFLDMMRRVPTLSIKLLGAMAGHVRRLTERIEDLSELSVRVRLAKKLLELADICGTRLDAKRVALPLSLSQQDLADHVQATRESVNKCLAGWIKEGVVYRTNSQIVIDDRSKLLRVIDED